MFLSKNSIKRLERLLDKRYSVFKSELFITDMQITQILDREVQEGRIKKIDEKSYVIPRGFCGNEEDIIWQL